jgi:polyribonucleotide nucleotidyltransferase
MDFKIAGTRDAVTAIQLDIKTDKVGFELLAGALERAKTARTKILDVMETVLAEPRPNLASHAPRIATLPIPQDKIGDIIGPGGRVIKKIIQDTGAAIDVNDIEGKVTISSMSEEATEQALEVIKSIVEDLKVGQIYSGTVKRIMNFGAFVEIAPGKEGLVHISELSERYVKNAADVVNVGDKVSVKLIGIDHLGRINLSKKQAKQKDS